MNFQVTCLAGRVAMETIVALFWFHISTDYATSFYRNSEEFCNLSQMHGFSINEELY